MLVKFTIDDSIKTLKITTLFILALLSSSLYAGKSAVNGQAPKPDKTFLIRGETIELKIRAQNEGLALLVKPAVGVQPFAICTLRFEIDDRPQALQPAGRCAFISMPLPAVGKRSINAFAEGDGVAERLSGVITIDPLLARSPSKKPESQWGTFAALLLFVIATLLGGLLALKRKT